MLPPVPPASVNARLCDPTPTDFTLLGLPNLLIHDFILVSVSSQPLQQAVISIKLAGSPSMSYQPQALQKLLMQNLRKRKIRRSMLQMSRTILQVFLYAVKKTINKYTMPLQNCWRSTTSMKMARTDLSSSDWPGIAQVHMTRRLAQVGAMEQL